MRMIELFAFLQLMDFLTTVVGLRLGAEEANVVIRWFMELGPVAGLLIAKTAAFILGGLCLFMNRGHVIGWMNYFFAVLVTWNLANILVLVNRLPLSH
jgi:hypothetical protein